MTKSPVDFRESLPSWLKSQLGLSKPKESLIDLNVKSDIQHPVYLKQITVARWNPKTPVGGSRVKGHMEPRTQKPILNRSHQNEYCLVSNHIKVNLTAVDIYIYTRSSGCPAPFLLAPAEGWGALRAPCFGAYGPIAGGSRQAPCWGPYGPFEMSPWAPMEQI